MIEVLVACFDKKFPEDTWNKHLKSIPVEIRNKIERCKRWQDRHSGLIGKLLLLEGLKKFGFETSILNELFYSEHGRPFLNKKIDFNISHSGEYVLCAISNKGKVGIDIEKTRPINITGFKRWLTRDQYKTLNETQVPDKKFFEFWTINESILKGDGRGITASLQDIKICNGTALLADNLWLIKELHLNPFYKCHLASTENNNNTHIREVKF